MGKRTYGNGSIDSRGPDAHRLRYRINGERFTKTFHGTRSEANKELRRLLTSGDNGQHVAPDKVTLSSWMDQWLEIKKAAKRRLKTVERYREILTIHVIPKLGNRPVQQIETREINALYVNLDPRLSPRSKHHVHVVLKACLQGAVKNKLIISNPVADAEAPKAEQSSVDDDGEVLDDDVGQVLDADELAKLVIGFKGTTIYEIVAVAAFTGMRRGEILALRWSDLDATKKTLRIQRALEYTRKHGLAFKAPKTARGRRTITIDDSLVGLFRNVQEKYLRMTAGVPDGAAVDLSLVKLPEDALIFPAPDGDDLASPRHPDAISKQFRGHADKLGLPDFRFHDLRGSHETILLDGGMPVHVVAARCGHDPAVLLRIYAKRTKKSDHSAAEVIGRLTKTVL
jgi:integrase